MKTVHLIISGKVQGVFFRASAAKEATSLNLTGWVKNAGGNVEAMVSGDDCQIDAFVAWAHKGPSRARVEKVTVTDLPYREFADFDILKG